MAHVKHMALASVAVVLLSGTCALAGPWGFEAITSNSLVDPSIGERQLFFDLAANGSELSFLFWNTGPDACSITEIYWDDRNGLIVSIAGLEESNGVNYVYGSASPPVLPGGGSISPTFQVTAGLLAESTSPPPINGINPGEWLKVKMEMKSNKELNDVLESLGNGTLRIGIHVTGFADGDSEAFINKHKVIPAPGAVVLGAIGLGVMGIMRRRRAPQSN